MNVPPRAVEVEEKPKADSEMVTGFLPSVAIDWKEESRKSVIFSAIICHLFSPTMHAFDRFPQFGTKKASQKLPSNYVKGGKKRGSVRKVFSGFFFPRQIENRNIFKIEDFSCKYRPTSLVSFIKLRGN